MTSRDDLFPDAVRVMAQHSQRKYGVPADVCLAQWALESDYGEALSGTFNPFGIKGTPGKLLWTWEQGADGKIYHVQAFFKNFASFEEAFDYHGHMLTRTDGYYARALPFLHDWRKWLHSIAPIYATDKLYESKIVHIIEANHLQDFNLPGT